MKIINLYKFDHGIRFIFFYKGSYYCKDIIRSSHKIRNLKTVFLRCPREVYLMEYDVSLYLALALESFYITDEEFKNVIKKDDQNKCWNRALEVA